MRTFVIGEIGSAWLFGKNKKENAYRAIDVAKLCGCDAIKFQWTSDPRRMEQRRKVPEYSYQLLAWPERNLKEFKDWCDEAGIEFMCTVFLPQDVETIAPLVKRFKVASLECDYEALIDRVGETGKIVVMSDGATCGRLPPFIDSTILHCTASYPAPLSDLNLKAIVKGFSDHSRNLLAGALAVACGAKIVEVHFRLDRTPKTNPDYKHSHCPSGLKQYVKNIRDAEVMLGDGVKRIMPSEQWALKHRVVI